MGKRQDGSLVAHLEGEKSRDVEKEGCGEGEGLEAGVLAAEKVLVGGREVRGGDQRALHLVQGLGGPGDVQVRGKHLVVVRFQPLKGGLPIEGDRGRIMAGSHEGLPFGLPRILFPRKLLLGGVTPRPRSHQPQQHYRSVQPCLCAIAARERHCIVNVPLAATWLTNVPPVPEVKVSVSVMAGTKAETMLTVAWFVFELETW